MAAELKLPIIYPKKCTGCGDCVLICPTNVLGLADGLAVIVQPDACTYCSDCETICPVGAIALPYTVVFAPGT